MSAQTNLSKLSVGQFAERFRNDMIPLSNTFSYFCASVPMSEEDLKEYLEEPIAALPPAVASLLPNISIMLVPYLERANGKQTAPGKGADFVCTEKPPENKLSWASQVTLGNQEVLLFGLKDQEVAEYHYRFYRGIAALIAARLPEDGRERYYRLLREELKAPAHGEVDEESWRLKQSLQRRETVLRKETKAFVEYAQASFIDTLTLYLHGICCDIDVDTGPRQLASRWLRKRLDLLRELFAPPKGYAVFPEELKEHSHDEH
jgi:hypothetical protein